MPRFRLQRYLSTTLGAIILACCVALLPAASAGAASPDAHDVLVSIHSVLRSDVGVPVAVDLNLSAPTPATIHADGTITIPKGGVKLSSDVLVAEPVPGTAITRVDVTAVNDLTGWIDTNSGEVLLVGDLLASLTGPGIENCPIGPVTVVFHTINPGGRDYDANTSSATLTTAPQFAIPPIATGAPQCSGQEASLNAALGLGIPSVSSLLVDIQFIMPAPPPPPPPPPTAGGPMTGTTVPPSAPVAVPPSTTNASKPVLAKFSTPARPKSTTTKPSTNTASTSATTTTTMHVWPTEESDDLLASPPAIAGPPTTFGRTPIAAEFPVPEDSADGTSLGIGVLVASLGAGIAGVVLIRSEARKLFRRRPHAAF